MTKKQIFKNGSTTFFYSSLFFPAKVKDDIFTLYAYVRVVDDAVDSLQPNRELLDELWAQTQQAWKGKTVAQPIVREFVLMAQQRKFEWKWITAFWWAMRQDLVKKKYSTWAELEKYMYGSAEVIGLMMAQILELPKKAHEAAQLQGKAMQLINFIRDVKEDQELGRVYLGEGYRKAGDLQGNWQKMVAKYLKKYQQIQTAAQKGYHYIPYRYLIPIKTAAEMYNWTAHKIALEPTRVWQTKIKPSKFRVVLTILKNCVVLAV
jgi:phytoene synthase